MTDNRQIFFDALKSVGLTSEQALGALWALGGESYSNLRTDAYNPDDPGGSIGVGQWNGPRRTALEAFARQEGKPVTDPYVQARYLVAELTGAHGAVYQPDVLETLKQAKTPQDAARIWVAKFERPKVDNSDARISRGGQVGTLDANGNFVVGAAHAAAIPSGGPLNNAKGAESADTRNQPRAMLASELGQALAGISNIQSSGGSQVIDPPDQPAIRSPALGENFVAPAANPVPANFAGGIGSQLGQIALQAPFEQPTDPGSITAGAPGMTALLGQVGYPGDPMMAMDPRRGAAINPYMRPSTRLV